MPAAGSGVREWVASSGCTRAVEVELRRADTIGKSYLASIALPGYSGSDAVALLRPRCRAE
eukprot:5772965-Prymnesium_polylepis.1